VVSGVSAGQYGILSLGSANELFIGGESTNPITFVGVPEGPVDFVGARLTQPGSPPDRLIVLRNLNIPEGGSLPAIDFNGSTSLPATATATIAGASGDKLEMFSELVTARSGRSLLWFDLAPSVQTSRPWAGLAPATMVDGDFHSVVVFATPSTDGDYRVALKYVEQVSNQALALGPTITAPSASIVASGPYPRLRFQGDLPVEYNKGVEILLGDLEVGNTFSIAVTGAYLAAVGDVRHYDVVMPDVGALVYFPTASRLTPGPNAISFTALGFTGPGVFDLAANLGSEYRAATKAMTVAVP
jgi:hypothetical protein